MRWGDVIGPAARSVALAAMIVAIDAGTAASGAQDDPQPQHVTVPRRLMCTSQRALREALHAIDYKDRATLQVLTADCHYSADGVLALVLQDNISTIKIRLFGANDRVVEYWTLPDTVRPIDKR